MLKARQNAQKNIIFCYKILHILLLILVFSFTACFNFVGNGNGGWGSGGGFEPDTNGQNGGGGEQIERDSRLITFAGEAWVLLGTDAFIFNSNKTFTDLQRNGNVWEIWDTGTWHTTNDNRLFLDGFRGWDEFSYSVFGNTLSLDGMAFIRTSNFENSTRDLCCSNAESAISDFRRLREQRLRRLSEKLL